MSTLYRIHGQIKKKKILRDGLYMKIVDGKIWKSLKSDTINHLFNKKTGLTLTWGRTQEEDPPYSKYGPFIVDMEISTVCSVGCNFCYKGNTKNGKNMSLDNFKKTFNNLPKTVCQIAFGIGDLDANPELFQMMSYCRFNKYNTVIPNITINGYNLTDDQAINLKNLCGAISVSRYYQKDICYDAIKKLTDLGHNQINMHMMLSEETYDECFKTMDDIKKDPRLEKLNAIVFLMLKPKGRGESFHSIKDTKKYEAIVDYAFKNKVRIGMDSCSGPIFLKSIEKMKDCDKIAMSSEPCESGLFSIYINVEGFAYPCSFSEGNGNWAEGISVVDTKDFLEDIWFSTRLSDWRAALINTTQRCSCKFKKICRFCPTYDLSPCSRKLRQITW